MAKEVLLTYLAAIDYENVIDYLIVNWGINVTNNFIERFDQVLILLSKNAGMFPFVDEVKRMQKCILTKHNILYFIETEDIIEVITIFDTRQDPRKLTDII
jgi:plasmid stabilization system protein ParE